MIKKLCDNLEKMDEQAKQDQMNPYAVVHDVEEFKHEADTETLEAELQRDLILCKKYPGHQNFVPVNDFSLEHLRQLPEIYQREDVLELVHALAELTIRMRVSNTSADRPHTFPDTERKEMFPYYVPGGAYPYKDWVGKSWSRVGSGFVLDVQRGGEWRDPEKDDVDIKGFTELRYPCPCRDSCREQDWARLYIRTALHVVFDQTEADFTVLEFFFNTDQDRTDGVTRNIRGGRALDTSIEGDFFAMYCYTHDKTLIHRVERAKQLRHDLWDTLFNLYVPEVSPVIVVSHPHGCGKVVTVGVVTEQKEVGHVSVSMYNTPTCPGSSGAPVLWWRQRTRPDLQWQVFPPSPHSGSLQTDGCKFGRCGQFL